MQRLMDIVRILCVIAGLAGMAVSIWAFIDPSAFPSLGEARGMLGAPPSPRWRAVFAFVFSLAIALYGAGLLRHRQLP